MSASPPAPSSFYARWLSPEGYLGAHLVVGFFLALVTGALFTLVAGHVFNAPATLAADAWARELAIRHETRGLTWGMLVITQFGRGEILATLSIGVIVWLASYHSHRRLYAFVATMAGGGLLNWLLKLYYQRARPWEWDPVVLSHGYSFPSGHAMGSMLFFGSLAYVVCFSLPTHRRWRLLGVLGCGVATLAIGASRIYLGVHYLSDVVAGYLMGLFWFAVCFSGVEAWVRWRNWRQRMDARPGLDRAPAPAAAPRPPDILSG